MKKHLLLINIFIFSTLIYGCSHQNEAAATALSTEIIDAASESISSDAVSALTDTEMPAISTEPDSSLISTESAESSSTPEILHFVDVYGEEYEVEVNPDIAKHTYQLDSFVYENDILSYTSDPAYSYRLGIDVSHYQGTIDWQAVKDSGIEFVFIRLGYRGYGSEGSLSLDKNFHQNIQGAQATGLDVGVYFFAQAINEEEAKEEAEFVLQALSDYELQLPVVYDPESILHTEARTDNVTGEQFTKNTITFCEVIKEAGYAPMIYSNMLWEAYMLDLAQLADYPVWYADYELLPQTPYHFEFWQYSNTGRVNGISGDVDLNIQLIPN